MTSTSSGDTQRAVCEGTWLTLPLADGGYGVGLVARKGPGPICFGYFFLADTAGEPTIEDVTHFSRDDAKLVTRFGLLGVRRKRWGVLGWTAISRVDWTMPRFVRHGVGGRDYLVTYSDEDPAVELSAEPVSGPVPADVAEDGLAGDKYVTGLLARRR